jgi:pimeloyl-ACP methyl ester carboxylesterase
MREKYLRDEAKMVVVSHDWGAIIAARLASEAASLADRWIISSIAIVSQITRLDLAELTVR